ncbi:hypothetical protein BH23ACT3_BH23ACT3_05810 [soil metagenome]
MTPLTEVSGTVTTLVSSSASKIARSSVASMWVVWSMNRSTYEGSTVLTNSVRPVRITSATPVRASGSNG